MRRLLFIAIVTCLVGVGGAAADQTLTGTISDSACGVSHRQMKEVNPNLTDAACTKACVKGGAKYVFASEGQIYAITNQNNRDLATYAGQSVTVTGNLKGNTITVSKIEKAE